MRAVPASVADRWAQFAEDLHRCERETFLSRVVCDQRVRIRYCDGYWGKVPQCPGGKGINPAAFTDPPTDSQTGNPLRQGNLSRNALRGFGVIQWDFAVHRELSLHESIKLQFRAEMFNILNHPNFEPPNSTFGSGGFGLSSQLLNHGLNQNPGGGGFSSLYQIGGPRSVQFALKLFF